ncbi:Clp protease N-terminal domain-containing protein [Cellulomonas sp. URHE0023]|uniref:Clp protease N-terminal domain-containing protein n=1 Tax=Cellulomonas sp. URHE0023 TaxID=1380354 RepID=UPI000484493E|nr:Clp protease N-terminal domain-containing protein [Cellulomonas sp. URHE0023]
MFERFASDARDAVTQAAEEATGADRIGPQHVLLGAVRSPDSVAARALSQLGVDRARLRSAVRAIPSDGLDADALAGVGIDLEAVRAQVDAAFGAGALDDIAAAPRSGGRKPFDAQAKKLLELSLREALRYKHNRIDTGHLLLAVVRLDDAHAAAALHALGLADDDIRTAVVVAWAESPVGRP